MKLRKPHTRKCSLDDALSLKSVLPMPIMTLCNMETNTPKSKSFRYIGDFWNSDLCTPGRPEKLVDVARWQIIIKARKLRNLQWSSREMMKEVLSLKSLINNLENNRVINESLANLLKSCSNVSVKVKKQTCNHVKTSLSHPRALRKWYSVVAGDPGFSKEAETALRIKIKELISKDYGIDLENNNLPLANEALRFMLTAVNGSWKIPIGYFLVNGLGAVEKSNLLKEALKFTHDAGVKAISVTRWCSCKHCTSRQAKCLSFNTQNEIFFYTPSINPIKWAYVLKLHELQKVDNLLAATKVRTKYNEWYHHKMNVRIAVKKIKW
ncbi:uncharacterized protein LOC126273218 [Schistocerca gregaria]|uniref:uncharacterized protein LOC126273218 n=1 Tax=Schistocerca gregaria TaxID=7010 RepID=UPI00211EDA33|nr:uncharacterized protein LOC126273218 [Schistocerca gregaria]